MSINVLSFPLVFPINWSSLKVLKIYISLIGSWVFLSTESNVSSIHYTPFFVLLFFPAYVFFFLYDCPFEDSTRVSRYGWIFIEPSSWSTIHCRPLSKFLSYSPLCIYYNPASKIIHAFLSTTAILRGIDIPRSCRFSITPLREIDR